MRIGRENIAIIDEQKFIDSLSTLTIEKDRKQPHELYHDGVSTLEKIGLFVKSHSTTITTYHEAYTQSNLIAFDLFLQTVKDIVHITCSKKDIYSDNFLKATLRLSKNNSGGVYITSPNKALSPIITILGTLSEEKKEQISHQANEYQTILSKFNKCELGIEKIDAIKETVLTYKILNKDFLPK